MANNVRRDVTHFRSDLVTAVDSVTDSLQRHLAREMTVRPLVSKARDGVTGSPDVNSIVNGCHLVQMEVAARSLSDDVSRLEFENRRLQSTIAEMKTRLTEMEFERDEKVEEADRQKQENIRWLVGGF